MAVIGIDIGGSGIKGAPVDIRRGELSKERVRLETPQPSDVERVVACVGEVVRAFGRRPERVGITFPGVIRDGVVRTAANVDQSWLNAPAERLFGEELGCPVTVVNDADAAGIAEMRFGAGKGQSGTVIVLTFGTGIGSAVFRDGVLVPNTEFGHIRMHGTDAERRASDRARHDEDLGWAAWAKRVRKYLRHLEQLLSPDLFVFGGGVSKKSDHFLELLDIETPVVPAVLLNNAGIIGAALAAPAGVPGTRRAAAVRGNGRAATSGRAAADGRSSAGTGAAATGNGSRRKATGGRASSASRTPAKTTATRTSAGSRGTTTTAKPMAGRKPAGTAKSVAAGRSTRAAKSVAAGGSTRAAKSVAAGGSTRAAKSVAAGGSSGAGKSVAGRKSTRAAKTAAPRNSSTRGSAGARKSPSTRKAPARASSGRAKATRT